MPITNKFLFLQIIFFRDMSVSFRFSPLLRENVSVALKSIVSNRLRSSLTIIIIAIGITSLIGILTAIDALTKEIESSFEQMGTNSFEISRNYYSTASAERGRVINRREISYYQARNFKEGFDMPSTVALYAVISNSATVKYGSESTSPNVMLTAVDEDYMDYSNFSLASGRNFTQGDVESGAYMCIIGSSVAERLFGNVSPLEKVVTISGIRFRVTGVTRSMGATFSGGIDNSVLIPIQSARGYFINDNTSFTIGIKPDSGDADMEQVYDRAEQLFRSVRRLSPADASDFRISKNDAMISEFKNITGTVTGIAFVIGLIILLGAAVGLMNIMLISVKERIAEIGTRRAIGASARMIKQQFLLESVIISETGCIAGIVLGVIAGNGVAALMGGAFVVPYMRILFAVVLCIAVGVLSGYIPAVRASRLDPIESLRHE